MSRIEEIAAAATAYDGVAPLDEATWRTLTHRPEQVQRWERPEGFALLIGDELSLVVNPAARGRGVGGELLAEALDGAARPGAGPLSAWSHGGHPAAARLAASYGFGRVRELWVMRRPTAVPLRALPQREDVRIRGYRDHDAAEVLRVNAAAFAHHPEQGAMDAADLAERMAEPWFDPAGLLLAHEAGPGSQSGDEGPLLGFHWTKQHSSELGEVYVVGIDTPAQGRGLGTLLTLAGLHHLAARGVEEVLLYVESDNAPAVAVYSGLGFDHAPSDTHVMYRR